MRDLHRRFQFYSRMKFAPADLENKVVENTRINQFNSVTSEFQPGANFSSECQ